MAYAVSQSTNSIIQYEQRLVLVLLKRLYKCQQHIPEMSVSEVLKTKIGEIKDLKGGFSLICILYVL